MWSHYASNHRGFCIEFRTDKLTADKVKYRKSIPKIALFDVMAVNIETFNKAHVVGQKIWEALRVKLKEWRYEEEYRFQLSNAGSNNPIKIDEFSSKMKYDADFVESVIFGCCTPEPIKQFIADNMPYPVKFKQAIETKNSVKIIDSPIISTQYRTSPLIHEN